MSEPKDEGVTFAARMTALEAVVNDLESGELSLESALRSFEEGIGLVRALDAQLNEAEQRIEVLTRNDRGERQLRPAAEGDD